MTKIPRKDTGGATHVAERGSAKTRRAEEEFARPESVAPGVPRFGDDVGTPRPGRLRVEVDDKGDALARARSPTSPLPVHGASSHVSVGPTGTDREYAREIADLEAEADLWRYFRQTSDYFGDEWARYNIEGERVRRRIQLMRARRSVSGPGAEAAEELREAARDLLRDKTNSFVCVQENPAAPLELEEVYPAARFDGWARSSDAGLVGEPSEVVRTEPSDSSHMLRSDGAPCMTLQLDQCYDACVRPDAATLSSRTLSPSSSH